MHSASSSYFLLFVQRTIYIALRHVLYQVCTLSKHESLIANITQSVSAFECLTHLPMQGQNK